ncbi:Guanine nucleotide-binding protein-like 3 [Chionoecetes opilio]|uniref:Guanine nucleotide-binding protein-like 3 n=1 Tax=Chionoecetes opilio TaxID=41210 RepID=A0A8J4XR01_CHIOP|nr:Guanine nucleotide-binding protein-like 3 [Chionoecetes opilio]
MVLKKKASKRITLKLKYKIQKKVKDHHKKLKREKKKHPEKFRRNTKDPGVPKTLPFYDKVIQEAEAAKEAQARRREEAKMRRREQRDTILTKKREIGNLHELLSTAEARGAEFEAKQTSAGSGGDLLNDRSAKAYYKEFKKVVEAADVVLEVLDARDPAGSRVTQLESAICSQPGKKLVLILNKADLVPRANLEGWLKHLRKEHPTVAFKSSTQTQNSHLSQSTTKIFKSSMDLLKSSRCLGADVLLQLLKNYCRNKDIKTAITVGVVGLPNVGKSSLINSLKRTKSCGVGATPGFTKSMQEVQLDSKIKLLDCPGIVLPGGDASDAAAALRNAVKIENLIDPVTPVDAILQRADKKQLMIHYQLPAFKTTDQFLSVLAKRLGKLKKKGVPNKDTAARKVLYDWNIGLIKYYTQPPVTAETEVGSALVSELSQEFDIDSLAKEEGSMLKALPIHRPSQTMVVASLGPVVEVQDREQRDMEEDSPEEGSDDSDQEEEEEQLLAKEVCVNMESESTSKAEDSTTEKKERWETELPQFDPAITSMKVFQKKMQKKARKENNRNKKRADDLTDAFENFSGLKEPKEPSEDYDFNEFWVV